MKKKSWVRIEIARIKLNPEQAVLSCCNTATRLDSDGFRTCDAKCTGGTSGNAIVS